MQEAEINTNQEAAPEPSFVKATPTHIIYHNEANAYTVLRAKLEETNETFDDTTVVIIGFFPMLHLHESYQFFGNTKVHPKYGKQYETDHFRKLLPQSEQGMVQYLSGELFPGIGKKTAERVVDELGKEAIHQILENPDCLKAIPHLPEDKARLLHDKLLEHEGLEKVMVRLSEFGFGPQLSMKIYQTYKNQTVEVIENNPYQLVEEIDGIGFQRADELAESLGFEKNDPFRIQGGCLYWLTLQAMNEGHTFMHYNNTLDEVRKLLSGSAESIDELLVINEIEALQEEDKIVVEEDFVYLPSLYFAEKGLVTNLSKLSDQSFTDEFSEAEFLETLGELEERSQIEYAPTQRQSIRQALENPVTLLTGGPGTGKTTVIKGIVNVFADLHGLSLDPKDYDDEDNPYPVALCAPTGRAAKRMTEATGVPAVTIHRLLGWRGENGYDVDEDHKLTCRLLIIDEMSMVDLWLANHLFKSLPMPSQVIIVGDQDQLPSVGPGQVLFDMLQSGVIPSVQLTDIYRQAKGSSIIELAHSIKRGEVPEDLGEAKTDRRFFFCKPGQIAEAVSQVCANASGKGFTPKDIQVLAPMYRGPAGINRLNETLQDLFNKKEGDVRSLSFGDTEFRRGDKVLQLANNPEDDVFNGDIGEIVAIIYAKETVEKEDLMVVNFDGTEVTYRKKDFHQLALAYCCSIHKSQGSEFPIVVLPLVKGYRRMLKRNLLYTAITRSKSFLILCGDKGAFEYAVNNQLVDQRHSRLIEKLTAKLGHPEVTESLTD